LITRYSESHPEKEGEKIKVSEKSGVSVASVIQVANGQVD
jgi:hypothetical protein